MARAYPYQRNNQTMIEKRRDMNENPMYEETVNKMVKFNSSSKVVNQTNAAATSFEESKTSYRMSNENLMNMAPEEYIDMGSLEDEENQVEIHKRTFEIDSDQTDNEYSLKLRSKCKNCLEELDD